MRSVLDRTKRRNQPVHVRGEGGTCGGVSDDFTLAPLAGWWEAGDDLIAAALLIDGEALEGVSELRVMSVGDFKEWFASDKSAASLRRPSSSRRAAAPAPASPFGGSGSADRRTAPDDGGGLDAPSMSFMGGGASPLRAKPREAVQEPPSGEVTSDPTTADGFLVGRDGGDEEDSGFGFVMDEGPEDSDVGGFSLAQPSSTGTPTGPAPPMMLLDDEDAGDHSSGPQPRVAAPMMLADDPSSESDEAGHFGFAMADDSETPRGPAPPMMLMDDEPGSGPAPPMMLDDDDDGPVGGLLGEVQGSDPFAESADSAPVGLERADSAFGPAGGAGGGESLVQSTYQGEMELVGVAGFSLAGEETAAGSDPFHDPAEDTGFYDERMSRNPRRVRESSTQPKTRSRPADGAMVRELVRLLRGYVVVHDGPNHTFGLPDGGLLRDAWSHEGSTVDAYVGFLRSKVAEGFIPRADRVVALVPGVRPTPIDASAIERAASDAGL